MRAILVLGLAWSIVICATPGLADRYVADPHATVEQGEAGHDRTAQARDDQASGVQIACGRAALDPHNPLQRTPTTPQVEPDSTGLCR